HAQHITLFPYTTLFRSKKSNLVSQISDAVTNTKPKTFGYEKLPQTTTVTETLTLPATSEYTDKLFNQGEPVRFTIPDTGNMNPRSEEHTSELQSRFDIV